MRTGKVETSKSVMAVTPERPAIRLAQKASSPVPTGLATPMPVITTRVMLSPV